MACKCPHCLVSIGTAGADEHAAGVAERDGLCFTGAVLAGNLAALGFLHDLVHFNQSIDEEHSGKGVGVIACHSDDTATLGTLHLLVLLLLQ